MARTYGGRVVTHQTVVPKIRLVDNNVYGFFDVVVVVVAHLIIGEKIKCDEMLPFRLLYNCILI